MSCLPAHQEVLYITKRTVFELQDNGIVLTEIALGTDIEHDIIPHMGFKSTRNTPKLMDSSLFETGSLQI